MNIFATDPCPVKSAQYLDNKRLIKMILETAQLLSTAVSTYDVADPLIYRPTHKNHPCAIWARTSRANFYWLIEHGLALGAEYTKRYKRVHKSQAVIHRCLIYTEIFPGRGLTPHPNCTTYKDMSDTYEAYKLYLNDKWTEDAAKYG